MKKVRNNTNGEYPLTFSDGHCIMFSRAEIKEVTEEESKDPYFLKELKNRRILPYKEPAPVVEKKEEKPKPKKKETPKEKPESSPTKTIRKKKEKESNKD
jgi:hypothetical protein